MAWESEIASIENYYANLLIIQYRNKPKARATIKLGVDLYIGDGIVFDLQNVLDIDTAGYAQLDLIGKILGCSRNIFGFNIDKKYFSFEKDPPYIDTVADYAALLAYDTTGLADGDVIKVEQDSNYGNATTLYQWDSDNSAWVYLENSEISYGFSDVNQLSEGLWKSYQNSTGSAFALSNEDYRKLLKFKALYNLRRGSWGDLDTLYYKAFGDEVTIVNNYNGTISYNVSPDASIAYQVANFLGYIQPPMGVGVV